MIYTCFFYILFSSCVLIYGIGLNISTIICDSIHSLFLPFLKIVLTVLVSTLLSYLFIKQILIPLNLVELYPLVSVLIFFCLNIFFEALIRITCGVNTSDFNFSFLLCLLVLNESTSIIDVIIISLSSILSFIILLPVFYSLKNRLQLISGKTFADKKSLLFIAVSIIIIAFCVFNVSWLTPGVLK